MAQKIPELPVGSKAAKLGWRAWFLSRPPQVQALIAEFPPNTRCVMKGETFYVLGYTEDDMLIVSSTRPIDDYKTAVATKQYLCAAHFRADA